MTPDERQLLSGLFDRMQGAANQPRDREAESFIGDAVRARPYAPYLMAQTVIVQDQALRAANERLQQLEAQVRDQQAAGQEPAQDTSFLGGLGRSLFGGGQSQSRPPVPAPGAYGAAPMPYAQQGQGGPWGNQGAGNQGGGFAGGAQPQGGGFLKGALGAAAGVAGGVLLADSIRGLFGGGNNSLGIASGFGGGGFGAPGGETIVNNYYDNAGPGGDAVDPGYGNDPGQDYGQDLSGDAGGGFDTGGDDSYNV